MHRYLKEYCHAMTPPPPKHAEGPVMWTPPQDFYNVNVDGAVFKDLSHCEIGAVICNNKGQIKGAKSKRFPFPFGTLEVEAKVAECRVKMSVGTQRHHLKRGLPGSYALYG